jgi:hypothetical protein
MGFVGAIVDPIDAAPSALYGACFAFDPSTWSRPITLLRPRSAKPSSASPGRSVGRRARRLHVERVHRHCGRRGPVAPHDVAIEPKRSV